MKSTTPHYIQYLRVSRQSQFDSGNGLAAQKELNRAYIEKTGGTIINTFTDCESGKNNQREGLSKAIAEAKRLKCKLITAKLDRLSRRCSLLFQIKESNIDLVIAERPDMSSLEFGIMAIMAQAEREAISSRTKQSLAIVAKTKKLGNPRWTESIGKAQAVNRSKTQLFRDGIRKELDGLKKYGLNTLQEKATALNLRGITTQRGGEWNPYTISIVLKKTA